MLKLRWVEFSLYYCLNSEAIYLSTYLYLVYVYALRPYGILEALLEVFNRPFTSNSNENPDPDLTNSSSYAEAKQARTTHHYHST